MNSKEALERLVSQLFLIKGNSNQNDYETIKTDLDRLEKQDEILRIIKEKECLFKGLSELTQTEFDLLKEWLK